MQYEQFCFHNGYKPRAILKNRDTLSTFGIHPRSIFDGSTDSFCGIRFATKKERMLRQDMSAMPNESTLSFFVRKECTVTPFRDNIRVREFTRKYEEFCRLRGKGEPVPITKRGMGKLGVEFRRLHVTCLDVLPYHVQHGAAGIITTFRSTAQITPST